MIFGVKQLYLDAMIDDASPVLFLLTLILFIGISYNNDKENIPISSIFLVF